jgi:hypothetical protein
MVSISTVADAIEQNDHCCARILLKLGATVPPAFDNHPFYEDDAYTLHALLRSTDPAFSGGRKRTYVNTALQRASIRGNALAVKRLLREESVDYRGLERTLSHDYLEPEIVYLIEDTLRLRHVHAAVLEENVHTLRIALGKIHWRDTYVKPISGVTAIERWFMHGSNVDVLRLLVARWTVSFSYKPLLHYRVRRGDLDTVTAILERSIVHHSARAIRKFKLAAEVFLFSSALPAVITLHMLTFCPVHWFNY